MSWFYDALKEAAKKGQLSGTVPPPTASPDEGRLLLDSLQAVSPIAGKLPQAAPSIAAGVTRTEVTETDRASRKKHSASHTWNNGFRHITPTLREEARLVLRSNPQSLAAEQFRFLRQRLNQEFKDGGVLMVTSAGKSDGKTLTSINLCSSFSDWGQSTLLVELDIHRPSIARILNCNVEGAGVESAFCGKASPEEVVHALDKIWFHAAMVAKVPSGPAPRLSRGKVNDFLAWARQRFRWIVLDAPPAVLVADVAEVLSVTDAALLVVRAQNTPRALLKLALQTLGSHLCGVVFNDASTHSAPHYKYLDTYYGSPKANRRSASQQ
jgi:Mrp family chromosome partitioning ATPase